MRGIKCEKKKNRLVHNCISCETSQKNFLRQKSDQNIFSDISYTEYSSALNFGEGLCVFSSFHFPDSEPYPLNGFDFYFDLF